MRDPDLERYVSALEDHVGRRRGRDHVLSPPDFALARGWYAGGVPVGDVIDAIDAIVAEGRDPTSLAPCRRRVEARSRHAPPVPEPGAETPGPGGEEQRIASIETALGGLDAAHATLFVDTRAALAALREGLGPAALERLERALAREAVAALDPAARSAIERRVDRAAARQRGRVADAVLEEARQRHLEAAARRALGFPE